MKKNIKIAILFILVLFFCVNLTQAATDAATACKSWYSEGTSDYSNCLKQYDTSATTGTSNAAATTSSGSTTAISFANPIGASTIAAVLNKLLTSLQSVVIIIAVIFIIIGGLMYMMSGGNEKTITRAKACVAGAIIGLAIVMAAPIFLREILTIFGGSSSSSGLNTSGLSGSLTLKGVATNILNLLLSILGIVAIISLVIGGGMYLTSYGDEKRIETAKKIVTYAIIGIVISLASLVIVQQVGSIMGQTVSGTSTTTSIISSLLGI